MQSRILLLINFTFGCLFLAAPSFIRAQPTVASVSPRQNEINVPAVTVIAVVFSENMDAGSLTVSSVLVSGNQGGFYAGTVFYNSADRTLFFTAASSFKEGEVISVVLTSAIKNSSGQPLSPAFQFSFTIAVEFGSGVFDERLEIPLGPDQNNPVDRNPTAIFAGDFNNDQYVDLAVVNNTSNTVSILLNRFSSITGSFELAGSETVGSGPIAVTGGDFDSDGQLDLAVANFDDNTISVLRNSGSSNFAITQTIFTAEHPTHIEARDYDNDGQIDLAVVVLGVNRLQVYLNLGSSFNIAPHSQPTGASPYGLTSGDFDNDGDLDIVVTNSGDNSIIVYKNDGPAQFNNSSEIAVPDFPTAVLANDLVGRTTGDYGDGFLDLVLVHPNINAISVFDNRSRDGGFVLAHRLDAGLRPSGVFIGDIDTTDATAQSSGFGKDHDLDLAAPNIFSNDVFLWRNEFNNNFTLNTFDIYEAGETPVSIAGADFDRDGDIDLAVTNLNAHGVSVLLNHGGRSGGIRFNQPPGGIAFGQVYVGDDSTRSFFMINPTEQTISLDNISNRLRVFTTSDSQATIGPGELFNFSITFSPTDTVVYQDSLVVQSTIFTPTGELRIPLSGEGIRAIFEVTPDTLNFGPVLPPQTATLPIEIFNRGNGSLDISELQFSNPAFSAPVGRLTVTPYSSQQLDITFRPQLASAYLDTLSIFNNDSLNSPFPLILLGGPNTVPPIITSADTVDAYEDSLLVYTATADDPDRTRPLFVFQNLPFWLSPTVPGDPGNDTITGTPLEGFPDTSFTVIALDGIFSDNLNVYVRVNPVNDPPVFNPINDQTTTELTFLSFTVSATDSEDSTLVLTAANLPTGALFTYNGDKSGTFTWMPPANSRGDYSVTFFAQEAVEANPLGDTLSVKITVIEALPDLKVESLFIPTTDITVNQTHPLTGIVRANFASVSTSFRLTFYQNGQVMRDTLVTGLAFSTELAFTYQAVFSRPGSHEIVFEIDADNRIAESDETNNSAMMLLQVARPRLVVRPNPFTPNRDGYNDEAVFDFSELVVAQPVLKIFNFRGQLLTTLNSPSGPIFNWNGRDSHGKEQKPGMYLYVLNDSKKRVTSGYLVLAR